jgi:chromosome segregation ATPase
MVETLYDEIFAQRELMETILNNLDALNEELDALTVDLALLNVKAAESNTTLLGLAEAVLALRSDLATVDIQTQINTLKEKAAAAKRSVVGITASIAAAEDAADDALPAPAPADDAPPAPVPAEGSGDVVVPVEAPIV